MDGEFGVIKLTVIYLFRFFFIFFTFTVTFQVLPAAFPPPSSSFWRMRIWFLSEDVAAALSLASLQDFQSGVCLRAAAIIFWSKFPHADTLTPSSIWPISSISQRLGRSQPVLISSVRSAVCSVFWLFDWWVTWSAIEVLCVSVITPYLWDLLLFAGSRNPPNVIGW